MEYDELEGVLYDRVGRRREASFARPRIGPRRSTPATPRTPLTRPAERRVDVAHAIRRMPLSERQVLEEHYSGLRPHPPRIRRPIVKKLLAVLASPEDDPVLD